MLCTDRVFRRYLKHRGIGERLYHARTVGQCAEASFRDALCRADNVRRIDDRIRKLARRHLDTDGVLSRIELSEIHGDGGIRLGGHSACFLSVESELELRVKVSFTNGGCAYCKIVRSLYLFRRLRAYEEIKRCVNGAFRLADVHLRICGLKGDTVLGHVVGKREGHLSLAVFICRYLTEIRRVSEIASHLFRTAAASAAHCSGQVEIAVGGEGIHGIIHGSVDFGNDIRPIPNVCEHRFVDHAYNHRRTPSASVALGGLYSESYLISGSVGFLIAFDRHVKRAALGFCADKYGLDPVEHAVLQVNAGHR